MRPLLIPMLLSTACTSGAVTEPAPFAACVVLTREAEAEAEAGEIDRQDSAIAQLPAPVAGIGGDEHRLGRCR